MTTVPATSPTDVLLTVGVTTRNRPESLGRCLKSLIAIAPELAEVIVIDDASDPPVEPSVRLLIGDRLPIRFVRQETNLGYIVARNRIATLAQTDQVLLLDDDTQILEPAAIWAAAKILTADPSLAAIAFAQAEADGRPWPCGAQPAPADYPCYTPSYIGFAHLIRRAVFLSLGGYRESFHFYGEEKEYCLRALDAGYHIAFLPACRIAHLPDPSGRDPLKYFRYYTRNDCLAAMYTLPWLAAVARITVRVLFYHRALRMHMGIEDLNGRWWLLRELRAAWPDVLRHRRAVRWRTLWEWRRVRREWPAYASPIGTEK